MKNTNTFIKRIAAMFFAVMFFSSCSKTASSPAELADNPGVFTLYSSSRVNIGSIKITKEQNGDARVTVTLNKDMLAQYPSPFELKLISLSLPSATLQPINNEGVSETYPVISSNKDLVISYDALMYMKDLQLEILDAQHKLIAFCDVH